MKNLIILSLALVSLHSSAQTLLQDSNGYSNLITNSSLLNLDLTNKVATFDYIYDASSSNYKGFIYGIQLKANVANDVGVLFSNEKVASNSNIEFLLGYSIINGIDNRKKKLYDILTPLAEKRVQLEKDTIKLNAVVKNIPASEIAINDLIKSLRDKSQITKGKILSKKFLANHKRSVVGSYNTILEEFAKTYARADEDDKPQIKVKNEALIDGSKIYYNDIVAIIDAMIKTKTEIDVINQEYIDFDKTIENQATKHLFFIRSGYNGSNFKYDENVEGATIKERFKDIEFNGWNAELGYNFNRKLSYLGLSFKAGYENNLRGLKSTTYTLKTSNGLITDGDFSTSEEVKAFSGEYERFHRYAFNIDFAQVVPIDTKNGLYMSLYVFMRQNAYENSELLKNHTQAGIGVNFLNSKSGSILGGLFIQTQDLFGNNSGKDSTLGKRVVFGLIAKASFKGTSVRN